ncbi:MAG: TIGR04219 family outer membrane beta-barrel protein [Alcanivorax sp.]|nr:TIGR04219 family outer membrane beta-barrel protein [Alcanivorax sp.]
MKRSSLALAALLAMPAVHAAPLVHIYGGGYNWDTSVKGTIASGGSDVDIKNDLGFDGTGQTVLYLGVEHAVPLVPNVRVRYMDLSDSASHRLNRTFTFANQVFVQGTTVSTSLDLKMLDGTLYYSPLDNVVKLDLGITLREVDGDITLKNLFRTANEKARTTFPMLHGAARINLPLTGLYVGGEVNGIEYNGSRMADYSAKIGLKTDYLLGVELGYSRLDFVLNDVSNLDADIKIGGPYLAVSLNF